MPYIDCITLHCYLLKIYMTKSKLENVHLYSSYQFFTKLTDGYKTIQMKVVMGILQPDKIFSNNII